MVVYLRFGQSRESSIAFDCSYGQSLPRWHLTKNGIHNGNEACTSSGTLVRGTLFVNSVSFSPVFGH